MKNLEHIQQALEASLRDSAQESVSPQSTQERELTQALEALSERLKHILSTPDPVPPLKFLAETAAVVQQSEQPQSIEASLPLHLVTSPEGIILTACDQACDVLGIESSRLGTVLLSAFIPREEWRVVRQMLQGARSISASNVWVITIQTSSGRRQKMRGTVTPMFDRKRQVQMWAWNLEWQESAFQTVSPATLTQGFVAKLVGGESVEFCLSQICQGLVATSGISVAWIAVCEKEQGPLSLVAHAEGIGLDWQDFAPMWWSAFSESHPMIHVSQGRDLIHGSVGETALGKIAWVPPGLGVQEWAILPLRQGDTLCGVFVVGFDQASFFDESLCAWLRSLRAQILDLVDCGKRLAGMRLRSSAMDSVSYAVCVVDLNGCVQWVNVAYARLMELPVDQMLGAPFRTFPHEQLQALERAPGTGGDTMGWVKSEVQEKRANGEIIDLEQVVTPVVNEQGKITHYVAILQDITGRKTAEAGIKHLAYHDPLTDLPNRVMFEDRLQQALAQTRRQGSLLAVLFLDLDNFKPVNDQYGHRIGDQLLRKVAKRLVACVRSTDTVARLSGDEFTIILQGLDRIRDIRGVTQKILDCLTPPIRLNGHRISVTISIGVAVYPNDATQPHKLLEIADHAMYQAKAQGGQRWVFATPEWNIE